MYNTVTCYQNQRITKHTVIYEVMTALVFLVKFKILLILQSCDWLAAFHLELSQPILLITV